jgi:uncharacterized Zn finger protein
MSKNNRGPGGTGSPTGITINLADAETVVCERCGNATFAQVVLLKKVSKLVSPTGQEGLVPIPVFACNSCGGVNNDLLPGPMRKKEEETKSNIVSSDLGQETRPTQPLIKLVED